MQTIVGVLRGGPSREHEVSLKTGATMLAHLPRERFDARDIYIDKAGQWHDRGRAVSPDRVLRQIDAILIGLHGEYGEDGKVQKILDSFAVPYAGSDALGSHFAMHKVMSKMRAKEAGLLTPDFYYAESIGEAPAVAAQAHRTFIPPVVVKPVGWGSSVGVSIVSGHVHVLKAIQDLFAQGALGVLVEELIRGKEATAGVVEGLRDQSYYQLPITQGSLSRVEVEEVKRAAKVMHRALALRHYSESDFIVSPKGVYYLETNSLPRLTRNAYVSTSLAAVGVPLPDFLTHLVDSALAR